MSDQASHNQETLKTAKPLGNTNATQALPKAKPAAAAAAQTAAPAQVLNQNGARQSAAADKIGVRGELEELKQKGAFLLAVRAMVKASPAWLTSMVVHTVVLLVLALLVIKAPAKQLITDIISSVVDKNSELLDELPVDQPEQIDTDATSSELVAAVTTEAVQEHVDVPTNIDTSAAAISVDLDPLSDQKAMKSDMLKTVGAYSGGDLDGRGTPAARKAMVARGGGNQGSEDAVALALKWLAQQQLPDGGWDFGTQVSGGTLKNGRNGATAMAVLPFLGAGHTHKEGAYKKTVQGGLYYLATNMKKDGSMMDGGNMYTHGIASICLAEAYAMTQDKGLHQPAQMAMNFIMTAQDKVGGGWRYSPGQAGDTSAVGWQLMALKSGHMGYLAIDPKTIQGATNFLNTVQAESGAHYGYTGPGKGPATTAVGLLSRMYLGWKKDHPGIQKGVEYLSKTGPSPGNMYFNYYATQVLHHYEGEEWKKWNEVMRDQLVKTQEKAKGPLEGSWLLKGDHGMERGGRIYCTSMCCMTLEVYYRHLPIYRQQASQNDFEGS